jgi:hypothetical protein
VPPGRVTKLKKFNCTATCTAACTAVAAGRAMHVALIYTSSCEETIKLGGANEFERGCWDGAATLSRTTLSLTTLGSDVIKCDARHDNAASRVILPGVAFLLSCSASCRWAGCRGAVGIFLKRWFSPPFFRNMRPNCINYWQ